ncbi:uncharacterized protein LOC144180558 [Haemaphysalis longicornis]
MDFGMLLALVTLSLVAQGTKGLRLLRLDVPSVARSGDPIWLNCSYDLERDQLYSVKWYKNNVEIYRYLPSETPRTKVYNMPGIHIDVSRSNISNLYLNDTNLHTEGKYRCEVSAESPSFQTERAQKELMMYELPPEDPFISGWRNQYRVGDPVNLTCSYGPSKPNTSLTWYINGKKVPTFNGESVRNKELTANDGFWHVFSRVAFVAQPNHFWHGAMEVRCAAYAALPYFVSSEEITLRDFGRVVQVTSPRMSGPWIEGRKDHYSLGSVVDLSCNLDIGSTAHGIKWLINDREAPAQYVSSTKAHGQNSVVFDTSLPPLPNKAVRLSFRLGEQHFSKGELRLKCVSRQVREFTATTALRTQLVDRRQSSGLQDPFSRRNGSAQSGDNVRSLLPVLLLLRMLAASV